MVQCWGVLGTGMFTRLIKGDLCGVIDLAVDWLGLTFTGELFLVTVSFQLFRMIDPQPRFILFIRQVKSFCKPAGILPLLLKCEGGQVPLLITLQLTI